MITGNSYNQIRGRAHPPNRVVEGGTEMARLINAALVDRGFCNLLLFSPAVALSKGYRGETFDLSEVESRFVLTVRASSLTEFAAQWVALKDQVPAMGDVPLAFRLNCSVS